MRKAGCSTPETAGQSRAAEGGPKHPSMVSCASRCAAGPASEPGAERSGGRLRTVRAAGLRGRPTASIAGRRGSASPGDSPPAAAAAAPRAPAALHIQTAVRGRGGGGGTVTASRRAVTPFRRRTNQRPLLLRRAPL